MAVICGVTRGSRGGAGAFELMKGKNASRNKKDLPSNLKFKPFSKKYVCRFSLRLIFCELVQNRNEMSLI